jgi:hypothetical protein
MVPVRKNCDYSIERDRARLGRGGWRLANRISGFVISTHYLVSLGRYGPTSEGAGWRRPRRASSLLLNRSGLEMISNRERKRWGK